jgi:UbiD family decarboxylase
MSFPDLRSFIDDLESTGDLVRITKEVDPVEEITIIQHKVLNAGGPALLFEHVKGSPYRLVSNLFGTRSRVDRVLGDAAELGQRISDLSEELMPPTMSKLWGARRKILPLLKPAMRNVGGGPVLEEIMDPPRLDDLPVLKCWPLDGGHFFTLPLVHTVDPASGKGNLGIYRLQRYDNESTGMHWQIEKGGGFHFKTACAMGKPLPISVILGGPPALTLAAIAPLPEGIDERMLAAVIMGRPLDSILRSGTGHRIPATAEFVLEGSVRDGDVRKEGPFGDHLGHYSHSGDFPVFRVDRVLARKDAIYPATVVGKPPQEDYYIGEALEDMMLPLLKMIKPAIRDVWAYPETGFHPLAVVSVTERYKHEGLKCAFSILGEGQLSLTKVVVIVDGGVDVRDFRKVSREIARNFDPQDDLYLIAPTAQDTLDFTGPAMNEGSRMIIDATSTGKTSQPLVEVPLPAASEIHADIVELSPLGPAVLMVKVRSGFKSEAVREALARHPVVGTGFKLHVLVSEDVPFDSTMMLLWGWFTRFDPMTDVHAASVEVSGNRLKFGAPIIIDATWKPGYRKPVEFDPDKEQQVLRNWASYGIGVDI